MRAPNFAPLSFWSREGAKTLLTGARVPGDCLKMVILHNSADLVHGSRPFAWVVLAVCALAEVRR